MSQTPKSPDDPRYGWVMVAVAFLFLGMGNGTLNSMSVFLVPLGEQMAWSRSETALGYSLGTLAFGLGGIAMGWLADRFSVRLVAIVGTASMGVSLVLMGSQSELWQFYLLYICMGGLGYSALWSPLLANLGNWFARNRGLAVGIATAGQMLGTGIVPFFARHLISTVGWRNGYSTLGYIFLGVLVPLSLLVRPPREIAAQTRVAGSGVPQVTEKGLHPRPWLVLCWLTVAAFLDRAAAGTIMIHIVALLQDKGHPIPLGERLDDLALSRRAECAGSPSGCHGPGVLWEAAGSDQGGQSRTGSSLLRPHLDRRAGGGHDHHLVVAAHVPSDFHSPVEFDPDDSVGPKPRPSTPLCNKGE